MVESAPQRISPVVALNRESVGGREMESREHDFLPLCPEPVQPFGEKKRSRDLPPFTHPLSDPHIPKAKPNSDSGTQPGFLVSPSSPSRGVPGPR